ncbi:tRNA (adenine(22)-N(1))-methyltransferase [Lentibacillus salinarum]|uniref:tRNA (Adenine(22)-N(1))-methyltransferase n=1 Tax=Lentibacillus salinarum TaxID=446820 RepID=A0ABW3ZXV9_9BACI
MSRTINLSRRLTNVASFIPKGARFADIGSDHAYLPCYVCLHDEEAEGIAGEVNEGPFQSAQDTVNRYDLSNRVDVRLGDGLDVIENGEIDLVVVAGMGGSLIKTILDEGQARLSRVKRIVVQPNIDEPGLRYWLQWHGYTITDEGMVEENGHIYEIIAADKDSTGQELTERQLLFGPIILNQRPDPFYRKWRREYVKRRRIIDQMTQAAEPDHDKIGTFKRELAWIEEVLHDDNDHSQY